MLQISVTLMPFSSMRSASFVVPNDIDPETAMLDATLQLAIVHIYRRDKNFAFPPPSAVIAYST